MPYLDEYYSGQGDPSVPVPGGDVPRPSSYQPAAADVTGAGAAAYEPSVRERALDWISRNMLSGGAGDIRNIAAALGPAAQAAGGLGRVAMMAQRAGLPAKAPAAIEAADQMFDPSMVAPVMRAAQAAGQGGWIDPRIIAAGAAVGVPAAFAAPTIYDIIQRIRARNAEPAQQ
jgi:hypothetical protein